jgi:hypothetical protein
MYIIPSIVIQPVYPCVYLSKYTKYDVYNVQCTYYYKTMFTNGYCYWGFS